MAIDVFSDLNHTDMVTLQLPYGRTSIHATVNRNHRYGVHTSRMTTNQRRDLRPYTSSVQDIEHSTRSRQESLS